MSRTNKAISGTFTSYIQFGVQILMQFLLAPLVLKYCSQETMGAYAIIIQIIGYLSLSDLGMNIAGNRYLAQSYNLNDNNERYRKILSILRNFSIGSSLFVSVTILIGLNYINSFINMDVKTLIDFQYSLYIYAFWVIIRSFFWAYGSGLNASQDLASFNKISTIAIIIRLGLSYLFIRIGLALSGLIIALIISETITGILYFIRHKSLYPKLKLQWKVNDKILFKEVFKFGLNFFIINLMGSLILYSDNIIVGSLFGVTAASAFYLTQMPSSLLNIIVTRISDSTSPAINELYAKHKTSVLTNAYFVLHRITFLLVLSLSIGYIFFSKSIISVWVGSNNYAGILTAIFCSLFGIVNTLSHVDSNFIIAHGVVKNYRRHVILQGILKISLSFLFAKYLGLYGIVMATFIANLPTSIYLFKRSAKILNINFKQYYLHVIYPNLIPLTVLFILCGFYYFTNIINLYFLIFCFMLISSMFLLLAYKLSVAKTEKEILIQFVLSFKKK